MEWARGAKHKEVRSVYLDMADYWLRQAGETGTPQAQDPLNTPAE